MLEADEKSRLMRERGRIAVARSHINEKLILVFIALVKICSGVIFKKRIYFKASKKFSKTNPIHFHNACFINGKISFPYVSLQFSLVSH